MTSIGLGLPGCLKLGPSSSSSKQFFQQTLAFRSSEQRRHGFLSETVRLSAAKSRTTDTVQPQQIDSSSTPNEVWTEFAERVSGEWDGFGADFSKEGEPIELPESVVPEAFREWEVKVFDWQTQCPTLAVNPSGFLYKLIRLLPTVGCEADAATRHSILERSLNNNLNFVPFAYQSNGCYVAIWPEKKIGSSGVIELEHCLVDPRDSKSRMRVIQIIEVGQKKMQLEGIKVFSEQWYGPFRNGEQLGGCAIRDSAFASTPALKSSSVVGSWQSVHCARAAFEPSQAMSIEELMDDDASSLPEMVSRDGNGLILLPKQLWCSSGDGDGDREAWFEAGWMLEEGLAITSKCIFSSDAKLKEIKVTRDEVRA